MQNRVYLNKNIHLGKKFREEKKFSREQVKTYCLEFQRVKSLKTLHQGANSQRFHQSLLNFDHEQWRV